MTEQTPGDGGREGEELGSVSEEAAKLFEALQDWAKQTGAQQAGAVGAAAGGLAAGLREVNEHLATGGADCRYCPVCQAIAFVRSTSPEAKAHLVSAASSLLQAGAALLATQVPAPDERDRSGVEHIDLDGDDWD